MAFAKQLRVMNLLCNHKMPMLISQWPVLNFVTLVVWKLDHFYVVVSEDG